MGELQDRVQEYKLDKNHPVKNSEIMALSNWSNQGLSRLELLPMDFTQLKFGVAEVQRAYFKLTAGLDYLYIYKRRMDGVQLPPATETAQTIGVFTTISFSVVQQTIRKNEKPLYFTHGNSSRITIHSPSTSSNQGQMCLEHKRLHREVIRPHFNRYVVRKVGGQKSRAVLRKLDVLVSNVARFYYTQSFFNFFGRAAIVPCRLV